MVMYQPKIGKSLLFSYKPPQKKQPPPIDLEKACPERMTVDGFSKPKKSCEPVKVPFRTFIKPYSERYPHCRLVSLIVLVAVMILLILVLLFVCGVFQEAKNRAASHSVGDVLQQFSAQPSTVFSS